MKAVLLLCLVVGASAWWPFSRSRRGLGESINIVKVKGCFVCGDKKVADARVRMVDKDVGNDDKMTDGNDFTNSNGCFEIEGQEKRSALGNKPDPVVKVYHRCAYGANLKGSKIRAVFFVPDKYIGTRQRPAPVMDLGTINLEVHTVHSPKGWGSILGIGRRRRSHRRHYQAHHKRH